jgi:tetratricopeptide (TPR) repeat protein
LNKSEEAEQDFLAAIKLSSKKEREREQIALSQLYKARGDHVRQLQVLNQAVQDAENYLANDPGPLLNRRAWLLATCPNDEVRDGAQALQDARRACEWVRWNDPIYLDTFAAAHAENQNFSEAIRWQTKALSLLTIGDDNRDYESRLKLYEQGKTFREHAN